MDGQRITDELLLWRLLENIHMVDGRVDLPIQVELAPDIIHERMKKMPVSFAAGDTWSNATPMSRTILVIDHAQWSVPTTSDHIRFVRKARRHRGGCGVLSFPPQPLLPCIGPEKGSSTEWKRHKHEPQYVLALSGRASGILTLR